GNDTLIGAPNSDDNMTGGAGSDVFAFSASGSGQDHLADFVSGTDTLQFDNTGFANLGAPGRLSVGDERFFSGPGVQSAHDASDRLISDTPPHPPTGILFNPPNGTGPPPAQVIAILNSPHALVPPDIVVVGAGAPGANVINGTAGNDSLTGTQGND